MHNCEPKCRPLFTDSDDTKVFYGTVQGPHNDSFDVIQKQCLFRKCEVGEYLFWPDMGSYSTNNCASLDGEPCFSPEIYYFIEENNR
jgi:diaminopimelate decarboxylase